MRELIVSDEGDFDRIAAGRLALEIRSALAARGRCSLCLAGGNTPRPVYERLAREDLPWPEVTIAFGDERAVPPDHVDSNYRMVRESLLERLSATPRAVLRMEAEDPDLDAAARRYAAVLPDPLDVLVLGMGEDGHTASLFPRSRTLAERQRRVVAVARPGPPGRGLSITPPVIRQARSEVVLVAGAGKAATVRRVLEGPYRPADLPAQLARERVFVLDRAAARELRRPPVVSRGARG